MKFKTKYDFDQDLDRYVEYLKDYISSHTQKELQQRDYDPKGYAKLTNNFMAYFLGAVDDSRTLEVLEFMDSQGKFDCYQLVQLDTLADVVLNGRDFKDGYDMTRAFVQGKVDSLEGRIPLTEALKLLNKARNEASSDEALREFLSKPFLRPVPKGTKVFELEPFADIGRISRSRKEYVVKSPLVKSVVSQFVEELEGFGVFHNSHFPQYPELYDYVNKLVVGVKEFDLPTLENLKYIFTIKPFYNDTLDRTDIKILKEIFFKKVVPKEWDSLLSQLDEENFINLQRSKSLKVVGLTINDVPQEKNVFDRLESSGKIRRKWGKEYSFRGYNLFNMMGLEMVNDEDVYLKLHYRDINATKKMLDEMDMWGEFESKIKSRIEERFPSLQEHLAVPVQMGEISYVECDRGYFRVDIEI